jgi:hypothetical protein
MAQIGIFSADMNAWALADGLRLDLNRAIESLYHLAATKVQYER